LSFNGKGGTGTRQFRKNVLNPESSVEVRRVKSIGLFVAQNQLDDRLQFGEVKGLSQF
jgi:hypothetical protein